MTHHEHDDSNKHGGHHVLPLSLYFKIWIALIVFTVITVATSYVDLGGTANIVIAMIIASTKALLVILFFMGLKYDSKENNVTFFISILFLVIFVGLTASDIFFRHPTQAAAPDTLGAGITAEKIDVRGLVKSTPELIAKGKAIFGQQCIACHGAGGQGDGPAAISLNPKPRNFTQSEGWKRGRNVVDVFTTLTLGVGGMPAFNGLKGEERFALTHYVRTLMNGAPETPEAAIAELDKKMSAGETPRLAVAYAMERLATESGEDTASSRTVLEAKGETQSVFVSEDNNGAALYKQYCISCHGVQGKGGIGVQSVGVNPPLHFVTRAFSEAAKVSAWKSSRAEFEKLVSQGIPGVGMPGFAQFTGAEWQSLYDYVRGLER